MTRLRGSITLKSVEIGASIVFLLLGIFVIREGIRLGPGWGDTGPRPGFFPFSLAILMSVGAVGVFLTALKIRETRPFFEAMEEVADLLKVGIPAALAIIAIPWLGLYITAGLYVGAFSKWYGRFRWYESLAAAVLVPLVLYILLRYGFNIPMPMSLWYSKGLLPV